MAAPFRQRQTRLELERLEDIVAPATLRGLPAGDLLSVGAIVRESAGVTPKGVAHRPEVAASARSQWPLEFKGPGKGAQLDFGADVKRSSPPGLTHRMALSGDKPGLGNGLRAEASGRVAEDNGPVGRLDVAAPPPAPTQSTMPTSHAIAPAFAASESTNRTNPGVFGFGRTIDAAIIAPTSNPVTEVASAARPTVASPEPVDEVSRSPGARMPAELTHFVSAETGDEQSGTAEQAPAPRELPQAEYGPAPRELPPEPADSAAALAVPSADAAGASADLLALLDRGGAFVGDAAEGLADNWPWWLLPLGVYAGYRIGRRARNRRRLETEEAFASRYALPVSWGIG